MVKENYETKCSWRRLSSFSIVLVGFAVLSRPSACAEDRSNETSCYVACKHILSCKLIIFDELSEKHRLILEKLCKHSAFCESEDV